MDDDGGWIFVLLCWGRGDGLGWVYISSTCRFEEAGKGLVDSGAVEVVMSSWLASGSSDPFWGVDVMGLAGVVVLERGGYEMIGSKSWDGI